MTTKLSSLVTTALYFTTTLIAPHVVTADATENVAIRTLATTNETGIYSWNAIMDTQGKLWTGVYTNRQHLIIKTPTATEIPLITDRRLPSGLALTPNGNGGVWVAYRSKAPERGIFLINSNSPATQYKISGDSLPLARIAIESDKQGGAYVLWYGEPTTPTEPSINNYWLWFNHINKDGQISIPEQILPGILPLWIHNEDGKIAVFSWYNNQGNHIGVRLRDTTGKFGPEITVAKIGYLSLPVGTFTAGKRWFMYWVAQYGELKDEFLIEGAYSDNQGQTWQTFNLEALKNLDVRNIATTADANGHIALVITGRYRKPQLGQINKFKAYLITSNDNGTHWNKPLMLAPEYAAYSQAPNAKVAFVGTSEKQQLLLLIEDWRTIRSSIRYWVSGDNGITWQIQDRIWDLDPKFNYQLSYNDESIYSYKDQVTVLIERLGDELASRTIFSVTKSIQDLITMPEPNAIKPDIERLKARVNLYGKALIDKNYQAAYDLFDPFYRARVDFIGHLQNQGRIVYTTAEFKDAQIQGNLATVQLHIIASIPPFKGASGEIMQAPPRDVIIPIHWLWIDGEWYTEFYSEARELRYTRY